MIINPNGIHLWLVPLNPTVSAPEANGLMDTCYHVLSKEEQDRADSFVFERHRRRFIFAHFALRKILGDYLEQLPEEIQFATLPKGKPILINSQNAKNIQFNLSHSGEMALVGLRTEKTIGVDIEFHRDRELLGIADHVFSDKECQQLSSLKEKELVDAFFHIWAQKEAFIKAVGDGLAYPLKDFTVSHQPPASLLEAVHEKKAEWYLYSFQPTTEAHAAIATLNPVSEIVYFDFVLK